MKNKLTYILCLVFSLLTLIKVQAEDGDVAKINVSADAYVQAGGAAAIAHGTTNPTKLIVKNDNSSSTRRLTFLKFIIPNDINIEDFGSAQLSLHIQGANTGVKDIEWLVYYVADDSWTESTITFNNKPSYNPSSDKITQVPTVSTVNANVRIIITNAVKKEISKDRIISLCIDGSKHNQTGDVVFYSKENGNDAYIPQLIFSKKEESEAEPEELLDEATANLIITKIRADKLVYENAALENNVANYLSKINANGSFSDIGLNNANNVNTCLNRWKEMAVAYTEPDNYYYENENLYSKIVSGLGYWYNNWYTDSNWWNNTIGFPRELGLIFVALHPGKIKFVENPLFGQIKAKWLEKAYKPDKGGAETAGANKVDIVMNWIYFCAVSRDKTNLDYAVNEGVKVAAFTTGEGIQHDYSMRQHGAQLYIGGYGTELAQLTVRMAYYLAGTSYTLSGDKLDVIIGFIRKTYLPTIRGQRMSYNAMGRQLSRFNYTSRRSDMSFIKMLETIDPANTSEYAAAYKRISKTEDASFGLEPFQTHYYRGEYTLQQRPAYTFDIRMISNRMARSEYDKKESRKSYFISDGATSIMLDGEEYGSIIPLFDWTKMPGTTLPAFTISPDPLTSTPPTTSLVRADSYIANGISNYAGGVTDGMHGVSAFEMINDKSLFAYNDPNGSYGRMPALNFGAKKSWFIFEDEIVCLGTGIRSEHEGLNVYTTVNQCRKQGIISLSNNNTESEQTTGTQKYTALEWVLNDRIAYFFPQKGDVYVSNETRTGSWSDVNTDNSSTPFSEDVFTLYFDHGIKPANATYAYIIVPNLTKNDVKNYNINDIEILANNDSVQAVYHKGLKTYGFAFYKAAYFETKNIKVDVDAGCVLLIKNADQDEASLYVADPQKSNLPINVGIQIPNVAGMRGIIYPKVPSPHTGNTIEFKINQNTPEYEGRQILSLLDRSDWTISCSINAPADGTVKGTEPEYIIDGDNITSYLFVKPGKDYGGIKAPNDYIPSFTIKMANPQDFNTLIYRHRTEGNNSEWLRASKISLYAKNNENDEFTLIMPSTPIATDLAEVKITLANMVNYKYVKITMDEWHTSGSTIQISEFNLGVTTTIGGSNPTYLVNSISEKLKIYPNPVTRGEILEISNKEENKILEIRDLYGKTVYITYESIINTNDLAPNIYILILKDSITKEIIGTGKLIVK